MGSCMSVARFSRLMTRATFITAALSLAGCSSVLQASTSDVAGIAGAGAANAVTKDAAIATGIGLGVAAAANYGLQYAERRVHRFEQDTIATAAGALEPGEVGHWEVVHSLPIESDEHGELIVTRELGTTDFTCREILFSVDTVADSAPVRGYYSAAVCKDGTIWKWATAEPATERWGDLQ